MKIALLLLLAAAGLRISVLDVEGGKAVLMVAPSGKSMLIDLGWPSSTPRIVEAVKAAGLQRIDYLLVTHYDIDHIGDLARLVAQVPVGHILDRGDVDATDRLFPAYAAARSRLPHTVLKAGDTVPFDGVDIEVLAAGGRLTDRRGGTANPSCAANPRAPAIASDAEDDRSIGLLISYGGFRMLDLADLEAHPSHDLVCPVNRIGTVDLYNVNVHGQFKGIAPELVHAIRARVILQANGEKKGADARTWPILRSASGVEDIWQLHYSKNAAPTDNPPPDFIANPEGEDRFHALDILVAPDGTFRVVNTRTGFSKSYRQGPS